MEKLKLTSVKIKDDLHKKFKIECINDNINLQKITNRTIYLYLNDEKFKKKILKENSLGQNL